MSSWLIWIIGIVYLVVAVDLFRKGQVGLGLAFIGYFIGNCGLGLAARVPAGQILVQ
jgi:hypothetical protein